jgi:hypothetical protein
MTNVHEILGRYAHMWADVQERLERMKVDREDWVTAWYESRDIYEKELAEARDWARFYKAAYDSVTTVEQSWVPPDAVSECSCNICTSQDVVDIGY